MRNKPTRDIKEPPIILIVDDEISIAETLAEFVMELGYTPLVAYNGQQALAQALERWPILVMTDLMMPLMNGAAFIQALRVEAKKRKKAPPPIILLSAVHNQTLADIHPDAIVPKPFDLDHLEQVVYRLLGEAS
ncbi:MAG: response regulator [Ktedonobacteraceae bacterium]|nr:response regulator [Ktedonobacteraceae bacterium]